MTTTTDLLAAYRKTPPMEAPKPTGEAEEYVAFGTKSDCYCVEIRTAEDCAYSPGYNFLLMPSHDRKLGTQFTLLFTFMVVHVRGKNLRPVIFALQSHKAEFIEKFDPSKWAKPKDVNAPMIDSIEIRFVESESLNGERQH